MVSLAEPAYPDDDGAADPALAAALEEYARTGAYVPVLAALTSARLIAPVVAVLAGERAADGSDKQADMAAVLMTGRDGRRALLAFTGLSAMQRWDPQARPVPVPTAQAALAALDEDAAAMVIDIAGPVMAVVEGDDLAQIAAGCRLVPAGDGHGWARPAASDG